MSAYHDGRRIEYAGEVVGHLDLTTHDAGLLARQLDQGRQAPDAVAALARVLPMYARALKRLADELREIAFNLTTPTMEAE